MKYKKEIGVLCAFLLLIQGCGSGQASQMPDEEREPDIVTVWTWDETFNVKAAKMAAKEYEKDHEEIQIVVETKEREEILSDIKNLLSVKAYEKLPDIMLLEDYDAQDILTRYKGEFADLTEKVDRGKFVEYKTRLCSKDGRLYGIPFDSGTTALFYRVDILERAGYTEEDMQNLTWEEYIQIGEEIYKKTGIPMLTLDPTDMPLIRLIMQSDGRWYVKEDGITADIEENESLRRALEIYQELLQKNLGVSVNGWNEFISAFQNGKVATVLSGGWIMSSIMNAEEQYGLWRVAPIPVLDEALLGKTASNVGGSTWYVLKHSGKSEEAEKFLVSMFGNNDEFLDELIAEIGLMPSLKDFSGLSNYGAEEAFFGGQQVAGLMMQMASLVPAVNYGSKTYEIEQILEEEFQTALADDRLDACLSRVQMKAAAVTGGVQSGE